MIAPLTPGLLGATASTSTGQANARDAGIEDAAKQLEGVFMSMLVDEMFKGTDLTGGEPIYGGLITQQLGDTLADAGGMGLAAMITAQLKGNR